MGIKGGFYHGKVSRFQWNALLLKDLVIDREIVRAKSQEFLHVGFVVPGDILVQVRFYPGIVFQGYGFLESLDPLGNIDILIRKLYAITGYLFYGIQHQMGPLFILRNLIQDGCLERFCELARIYRNFLGMSESAYT